jgi:2-polyprenyl-3-methyl-5-hydroxy-6-metoxy-1,4-benzoquinol methylase
MKSGKKTYILDSKEESARLDRQSRMKAYCFEDELQFLEIRDGQKILDAGCGSGIVTDYLARCANGVKVVGWDFSSERIASAKGRYGSAENVHFAGKNLLEPSTQRDLEPFGGGRFDVIVCRYVLRHFSSPNGKKVLRNLYDALMPGGTLYCVDVEGVLGEVFPCSTFLKKSLTLLREAKSIDFQVARKLPQLLVAQGLQDVSWNALISEFKGTDLPQEVDNLRQAIAGAEPFVKKTLKGTANSARFQREYFSAISDPNGVLIYNRIIAQGTKPTTQPTRIV